MQLIDADKLNARLSYNGTPYFTVCDIDNAPAVDASLVVYGKDIYETHDGHCEFKCSVCQAWIGSIEGGSMDGGYFNYCPNCGAKMEVNNVSN